MKNFNEYEIALNFSGFQNDIENYKKVITKLKRKKIDFELEVFAIAIKHLQDKEQEYFEMMKDLFAADEEDKTELIEELSFLIYNRRGIQQRMFDYEMGQTNN